MYPFLPKRGHLRMLVKKNSLMLQLATQASLHEVLPRAVEATVTGVFCLCCVYDTKVSGQ